MHVPLIELWMPILVSSVLVFIASFIAWAVSPHHKGDFKPLPNEDGFLESLRTNSTPAGMYMFPWCADAKNMKDPAFKQKWEAGPHGTLNIRPAVPNMGKNLVLTFLFYLIVGVFVAYLTSVACPPGTAYLKVFQVSGCATVMAYVLAIYPHAIWMGRPWRAVVLETIDGMVFGVLTAGVFGWLWPDGNVPA